MSGKLRKSVGRVPNSFLKKKPSPWDGICCESCWNATEIKCRCKCSGRNHGRGHIKNYPKLDDFPLKFEPEPVGYYKGHIVTSQYEDQPSGSGLLTFRFEKLPKEEPKL